MRTFHFKIAILLVLVISCTKQSDDTWDVIAVGIPKELSPKVAEINMGLYMLKQTHEPFLYKDSDGQYRSGILSSWSRSIENKDYNLCLKQGLHFTPSKSYTDESFQSDIRRIATKYSPNVTIKTANSCIKLNFPKKSNRFLYELAKYENAPNTPSSNPSWNYGLGDFYVTKYSDQAVSLKRKEHNPNGYNQINFFSYKGKNDPSLRRTGVEDYNRVLVDDLPLDILKEDFNNYPISLLQTVNLLINHENKKVRKRICNCLDVKAFRQAFMPNQKVFSNVKSILPVGVPGAEKGLVEQNCTDDVIFKKNLVFKNWNQSGAKTLEDYLGTAKAKSLNIELKEITTTEFVNSIFMKPHPYNLTVVAIDAVSDDYESFFWATSI